MTFRQPLASLIHSAPKTGRANNGVARFGKDLDSGLAEKLNWLWRGLNLLVWNRFMIQPGITFRLIGYR